MTIPKLVRRSLPLLLAFALGLAVAGLAFGTLAVPTADQATPKVVKLKFENDRVRILETVSNPGDHELQHSHPGNVVVVLEGAKLRIQTADGKSNEVEFKTGDAFWRDPVIHSAENIGTTRLHAIIVELKQP